MANINVTYTENTITVDENTSNVTVATTTNNITVSSASVASNADIRAAISATSPITYNSTTGVIGINSNAILTGKTTSDLPEGANLYFTNARVAAYLTSNFTTTDIPEGANLYYTTARANAAFNNIVTSNVVTFENVAVFNEGIRTPLYNAGDVSGTVLLTTENGTAQEIRLTGNVGYLSFSDWFDGQVLHVVVKQDATGGRIIDFTNPNYAANGWEFYNADTSIDTAANAETLITIQNFSSKRYATIHTGNSTSLTNAQVVSYIANNSLTVGGNLTVTSNNTTTGNILIPGWDAPSVVSPGWTNKGYIQIPGGGNLYIGGGSIDVPGAAGQPINLGKPIYSPYSATFEQALTVGSLYADGGGNVVASGNISGTYVLGNGSQLTGMLTNAQVVSYIATQPLTVGGNLTVNGNINATGNINYQNVTDLYVTDQKITLNSNAATNANVEIISNRPTATSTMLKWNEPSTRWEFTNNGTTYYPIPTSTSDLAEGTNFYFTAARVRGNVSATSATGISYDSGTGVFSLASIPNSSLTNSTITINGKIVALGGSNTLTTSDIGEGTNLYYTTDRANTAIGAYQGSINTPGNITAGNVITTNIHTNGGTNLVLNANTGVVIRETIKGVATNVGNISGDGYAPFNIQAGTAVLSYSGSTGLNSFLITTGNTVNGNATITGVTVAERVGGSTAAATLANITQYYAFGNTYGSAGFLGSYPFPPGTFVQSVDVANSTITMNQAAAANVDFAARAGTARAALIPGAYDSSTGYLIAIKSTRASTGSGSATTILLTNDMTTGNYGYPQTGPVANNFVYSIDTGSNYAATSEYNNRMIARTSLSAPSTVFQAPRGLVVGNGDLTNRAENDNLPSFGINLLWDGTANVTTDYAGNAPITQLLVKQYSDNSLANGSMFNSGPRIFFTAAQGNKNQPYSSTYLRQNAELGRITWWAPTDTNTGLSTLAPPAYINAVTNRDITGSHNGGVGMYLSASPNNDAGRRGLFAAHQLGTTLIASSNTTTTGASQPIVFAPMYTDTTATNAGNAVLMFNNTLAATNYQWANINYDNTTTYAGSRLSITNGASTVAGRNGNIVIALDRNDNGAGFGSKEWAFKLRSGQTDLVLTEDDVIRTTFAGANITTAGNITASTFLGNISGATGTFTGNVGVSGNINLTGRLLGYDQVYGEFCYTGGNIVPAAADTIYAFPLDTTNMASDVVANNTSRINIVKPGRFKLITSIQVKNADNANDHIMRFWLRKNGADVANSATLITPLKLQEQVIAMDWMVESDGDDYWEIVYYVNDTDVTFPYYAAGTTPVTYPAAPPIIVNVIPVGA